MSQFSLAKLFGVTIRESATDGSDFTNPDADYRRLFLGEDGLMHLKDSAGTVTDVGSGGVPPAGTIVQVKTANSTSDDVTTAATMQVSSLSLAFTPLYSTSILHINVDGDCDVRRTAGTIAERYMSVQIYNSTNSAIVATGVRGTILIGTSSVATPFLLPIALKGLYTVNSTAARTFQLRYESETVTNVQATIVGTRAGGVTMTITEVKV